MIDSADVSASNVRPQMNSSFASAGVTEPGAMLVTIPPEEPAPFSASNGVSCFTFENASIATAA